MSLKSKELLDLKDTDEVKIFSNGKEYHMHWNTLKSVIAAQVTNPNDNATLDDYFEAIIVTPSVNNNEGAVAIGNTAYEYVYINPASNLFIQTPSVVMDSIPSYASTVNAEADGTLMTGSLYYLSGTGAVYRKLT